MLNILDEFSDLPEDPELAFAAYEARLRLLYSGPEDVSIHNASLPDRKQYITKLLACHDAFGLSLLERPVFTPVPNDFEMAFSEFIDQVDYVTSHIKATHSRRLQPISVVLCLSPEIKTKLHSYTDKIRETISHSQLAQNKKEALFRKLHALNDEIDRDRTKTEALMALAIEVAGTTGQMAKELQPIKDIIDSITSLLGKAKKMEETTALPSPLPRARLEKPKPSIKADQAPPSPDEDRDEIPF